MALQILCFYLYDKARIVYKNIFILRLNADGIKTKMYLLYSIK